MQISLNRLSTISGEHHVGWVEQMSGIGAKVAGEIRLPDGTVTAECESLLTDPPASFKEAWENEQRYWKVDQ